MKRFAAIGLAIFAMSAAAQNNIVKSLQRDVSGQGKVTIHQDERITVLIGSEYVPAQGVAGTEPRVVKSTGYRVQVFAGNNTRLAKNEAHSIAAKVRTFFPDLTVYTSFNPPRWLCRAGDFRSIEEADAMMRRLRATGEFKEVSIVKDHINISYE